MRPAVAALWEILRAARIGGWAASRSVVPGLAGLLLPLIVMMSSDGMGMAGRLAVALVATLGWQMLFALSRKRGVGLDGLVTATIFVLLLPQDAPLWQVLLGISFGVVLGEQVFGGRGRNFIHPAVVGLAFLMFSFPEQDYRADPDIPVFAALPALVIMMLAGQASWRILLSAAAVMVLAALSLGPVDPVAGLVSGAMVLALVLLAADPVASAATNPGRWVHGALLGGLAGLFGQVGAPFGALIFAILLTSIFAPLIDHGVIALHASWRARRHG